MQPNLDEEKLRVDAVAKRWRYWTMLKRAKVEFLKLTDQVALEHTIDDNAFYYYLQRNYGLKIELIDGKITSNYEVVDEGRYIFFVMKYGA